MGALARSIEQRGQLIACIAVQDADGKRLILIDGYQTSPSAARERMAAQPRLFIQSQRAQEEQRADTRLAQGP